MRKMQNNSRRGKRSIGGCGTGFFLFLLFIAAIISAVWYISNDGNGISDKIRKVQYPIKYQHFVEKYSKEYGVKPSLVYGVIRTESRFDVYAVSSADAKGLMQITDETGTDCAKKLGMKTFNKEMLFDPETNIKLGCYYLKSLLNKYGYVENALAAYNGGPGNADNWLKNDEYKDKNGRLVKIPFSETSNYVSRVLRAQTVYQELYNIE